MNENNLTNRGFEIASLLFVLFVAFCLRLYQINFGLPQHFHPDEDVVLLPVFNSLSGVFDSGRLGYPWWHRYTLLAILKLIGTTDPTSGWIVSRVVSALFSASTVLMLYFIGRLIHGSPTGLTAAVFLTLSPIHVLTGHLATVDSALAFWLTATLFALVLYLRSGRYTYALTAAALAGLSIATKYNAAPALLVILVAWLSANWRQIWENKVPATSVRVLLFIAFIGLGAAVTLATPGAESYMIAVAQTASPTRFSQFDRSDVQFICLMIRVFQAFGVGLILVGVVSLVFRRLSQFLLGILQWPFVLLVLVAVSIFLVGNFPILLKPWQFVYEIGVQMKWSLSTGYSQAAPLGRVLGLYQFYYGPIWLAILFVSLLLWWRTLNPYRIVLIWLPLFLFVARHWPRYLMPLEPVTSLVLAYGMSSVANIVSAWLKSREQAKRAGLFLENWLKVIPVFVLVGVLAWPTLRTLQVIQLLGRLSQTHTLTRSLEWAKENLPDRARIWRGVFTPELELICDLNKCFDVTFAIPDDPVASYVYQWIDQNPEDLANQGYQYIIIAQPPYVLDLDSSPEYSQLKGIAKKLVRFDPIVFYDFTATHLGNTQAITLFGPAIEIWQIREQTVP